MATTTITVSSFQTACAEVADAIIAQDWALASRKYAVAEAINAGLELSVSDGGQSVTRRSSLEKLNAAIGAARAATSSDGRQAGLIVTTVGFGS